MKPLRQTLLWLLKSILLILAIAALILWPISHSGRSLWLHASRHFVKPDRIDYLGLHAVAYDGNLKFGVQRIHLFGDPGLSQYRRSVKITNDQNHWQWSATADLSSWNDNDLATWRKPVRWWSDAWQGPGWTQTTTRLSVPCWLLALAAAAWPLLSLTQAARRRLRRRKSRREGRCPTCGYDLRATPNRCPECGTTR